MNVYSQIEQLLDVQRYPEAKKLLADQAQATPGDPKLNFYAARIAFAEDEYAEAEEQLKQCLASDPDDPEARRLLYFVYIQLERLGDAESVVIELLREYPEDASLMAAYGRLMLRTLNVEKARALIAEALRIDPTSQHARLGSVLLDTMDDRHDKANETLAEMLREDPEALHLVAHVFDALVEQKRFAEAHVLGKELVRARPQDEAFIQLAVDTKVYSHWLSWPAYFNLRFGWRFSMACWAVVVVGLRLMPDEYRMWTLGFSVVYLSWVVYTWTYAPVLRRWFRYRGV